MQALFSIIKNIFSAPPLCQVSGLLKFLIWKSSITPSCWQITGIEFSAQFGLAAEKDVYNLLAKYASVQFLPFSVF